MDDLGYTILKEILANTRYSLSDIARKIDVSREAINSWKNRKKVPEHYISRLNELLNTTNSDNLSESDLIRVEIAKLSREYKDRIAELDKQIEKLKCLIKDLES